MKKVSYSKFSTLLCHGGERDMHAIEGFPADNGRDYTSDEFEDYYRKHRICHEKTELGTSLHNGVAERMNMTIVETVRLIL